ncbi:DoxX family protein [bacterium]|nr:DoxX family protein [bacterium]MCI0605397.1 DoxX family protein [bacterium]
MNTTNLVSKWIAAAPYLHSVLRIVAGLMFFFGGMMNLFAFPVAIVPGGGTVPLMSQGGIGSILQFVGGALLVLGLFTRPVAFILSGMMAVAYFQFHAPQSFWPMINMGMPAVLYCFIWLYFSAAGAGPWSLDSKRNSK